MWVPLALSLCGALVTAAGIAAIRLTEVWADESKALFASFAGGVLVGVSILHLVPEAIGLSRIAPSGMLAGFAAMHAVSRLVADRVCGTPAREAYAIGLVSLAGITFHSLVDGMIYSVTFSVNPVSGLMVAAGMIAHEFPEGIVTYALLRCGGVRATRAVLLALFAAGLTTPLGMAISYPLIDDLSSASLGLLLAVAAGVLLHVGATHLLPQADRDRPVLGLIAVMAGLLVVLAIGYLGG